MFFDRVLPNAFVETAQDHESTFGLDVDTGSYTIGRRYLSGGRLPPPESVRVEEYLNAFDYGDAPPRGRNFAIHTEGTRLQRDGAPSNRHWLRIGVAAREVAPEDRQPAALTFLVDTSGSMQRENRLELVKRALVELLGELRGGDTVALVTYGTNARVVLAPTADREAVRRSLEQLYPEGYTNLADGMRLAYEMASRNARDGQIDRIILCSDGVANVGITDPEDLLRSIAAWASRGIELTAVGFGMGNYNDALMEQLANRGDGNYAYVDRLEEARRVFVENLTGTLQTVAADARIQVTFDPEAVLRYRLVGYENRDLPDQAFRDPRTDAGEIGAGHKVTALYELELATDLAPRTELGEVRLRYRSKATGNFEEMGVTVRASDLQGTLSTAAPSLRLALLVARFAEELRLGEDGAGNFDRLLIEAQNLVPEFPGRTDVLQLATMIERSGRSKRAD
jgi:Ca-activated chloride channel family protein